MTFLKTGRIEERSESLELTTGLTLFSWSSKLTSASPNLQEAVY